MLGARVDRKSTGRDRSPEQGDHSRAPNMREMTELAAGSAAIPGAEAAALGELGDRVIDAEIRTGEQGDARLSPPMLRLLRTLATLPVPTATTVASALGVGLPTVSRLVDRAVAAGLVLRRPSEQDRREVRLTPTRSATSLMQHWSETRTAELAAAVDDLSTEHRLLLADRLAPGADTDQTAGAARVGADGTGRPPDPAGAVGRLMAALLLSEPEDGPAALTRTVHGETRAESVTLRLTDFPVRTLVPVAWTGTTDPPATAQVEGPDPVGQALRTQQPVLGGAPDRRVVDVPLAARGERAGVLTVIGSPLDPHQLIRVVQAMGDAFALALPGLIRGNDHLAGLRRTSQFTVSAEMQWQQLNSRGVATYRFSVAAQTEPACSAGNESYDWACTSTHLQLAVLDCSGSRERAATATALALGALRNARRGGLPLPDQAALIDQALWDQFAGTVSAEAVLLDIDLTDPVSAAGLSTGQIGLFRERHGHVSELQVDVSLPLGMFDGSRYRSAPLDVASDDRLVLVTDGLGTLTDVNATTTHDLTEALVRGRDLLPAELVRHLLRTVDEDPAGDATAVCIDLRPAP